MSQPPNKRIRLSYTPESNPLPFYSGPQQSWPATPGAPHIDGTSASGQYLVPPGHDPENYNISIMHAQPPTVGIPLQVNGTIPFITPPPKRGVSAFRTIALPDSPDDGTIHATPSPPEHHLTYGGWSPHARQDNPPMSISDYLQRKLVWNVSIEPQNARVSPGRQLITSEIWHRVATGPAVRGLRIIVSMMLEFDITSSNPDRGVTIDDVLTGVHNHLGQNANRTWLSLQPIGLGVAVLQLS